jgi:hypothetical protein
MACNVVASGPDAEATVCPEARRTLRQAGALTCDAADRRGEAVLAGTAPLPPAGPHLPASELANALVACARQTGRVPMELVWDREWLRQLDETLSAGIPPFGG